MIKIKSGNYVLFAVLLGALLFSTVTMAKVVVELELDDPDTPTVLKIKTNDSQCDGGILECIKVPHGNSPNIIFKLPGACGIGDDDPQYKLASMRITQIEKVWPTSASPLNAVVAADFKADAETGEIDFENGNNKQTKRKLKFKNHNSHEYTVFYEITATHCDSDSDEDDIHLDPEIRNKGNN
jgi:hypothetical protein